MDAPKGTRTPVWALRGPRPGPLDDGGVYSFPFYKEASGIVSSQSSIVNKRTRSAMHEIDVDFARSMHTDRERHFDVPGS